MISPCRLGGSRVPDHRRSCGAEGGRNVSGAALFAGGIGVWTVSNLAAGLPRPAAWNAAAGAREPCIASAGRFSRMRPGRTGIRPPPRASGASAPSRHDPRFKSLALSSGKDRLRLRFAHAFCGGPSHPSRPTYDRALFGRQSLSCTTPSIDLPLAGYGAG